MSKNPGNQWPIFGAFDQSARVDDALADGMEMVAMLGCSIASFSRRSFLPCRDFGSCSRKGTTRRYLQGHRRSSATSKRPASSGKFGLGDARIIITGSAPCPRDVQDWFLEMGIALRDGYGMTENSVNGCAWIKDDQPISGCMGQPMDDGVKVRISEEGEIQFKSKGLTKGCYLESEKTAEVIKDGWYCSGDSGKFDEDGNLWVTGRVSEVFKTSKGKFVVSTRVEDFFGRCVHLAQFCVMGHGLDGAILLASLSETGATQDKETVRSDLEDLLNEVNDELAPHERVGNIFVVPEWTLENALLTPTMKIKRKLIEETYRPLFEPRLSGDSVQFLQD